MHVCVWSYSRTRYELPSHKIHVKSMSTLRNTLEFSDSIVYRALTASELVADKGPAGNQLVAG